MVGPWEATLSALPFRRPLSVRAKGNAIYVTIPEEEERLLELK